MTTRLVGKEAAQGGSYRGKNNKKSTVCCGAQALSK